MSEHRGYRENNRVISVTVNHPATDSLVNILSEAPRVSAIPDFSQAGFEGLWDGPDLLLCSHMVPVLLPSIYQKQRNLIA